MATNFDISVYRGTDKTVRVSHIKNDVPVNLAGALVRFTAREFDTGILLLQKSSLVITEIAIVDAINGIAEIYIVPDDTKTVVLTQELKSYFYDIKTTTSDGKVYTFATGMLYIIRDASYAT